MRKLLADGCIVGVGIFYEAQLVTGAQFVKKAEIAGRWLHSRVGIFYGDGTSQ